MPFRKQDCDRSCRHCGNPLQRFYDPATGRFKNYRKTCGSKDCRFKNRSEARRSLVYAQRTCGHCSSTYTPTSGAQRWCKNCVPHKKARTLMRRYGLSWPEYLMAIAEPCPLCGNAATVIDHDHETGARRSALCTGCNIALGRVEVPGWTDRASAYLEEHASAI